MHLHGKSYGFIPELLKEEYAKLKKDLAAASKAERTCARVDKESWAEERARLERLLAQTRTRLERTEREAREREVLAKAKKEEREKREGGKGAWYMKKGECECELSLHKPPNVTSSSNPNSRRSRTRGASWLSRRQWTRSERRLQARRRNLDRCSVVVSSYMQSCIDRSLTSSLASSTLHVLLGHFGGTSTDRPGLLVGLLLPLLGLGLGDGSLSSGSSDLGFGSSLGEDGSKVGADNSTLTVRRTLGRAAL